MAGTDQQIQQYKWKRQPIPPHSPCFIKYEGILSPVDLVWGTSTLCLYLNLLHQSLPQFSQRPGTPNHFMVLHLQGLDFIKRIHLYNPLWLLPWPPEVLTSPPTDRICHMPLEMHSSLPIGGTLRKHLLKKSKLPPVMVLWRHNPRERPSVGKLNSPLNRGNTRHLAWLYEKRHIFQLERKALKKGKRGATSLSSQITWAPRSAVAVASFTLQWQPNALEIRQQLWDQRRDERKPIAAK